MLTVEEALTVCANVLGEYRAGRGLLDEGDIHEYLEERLRAAAHEKGVK